MNIITLSHENIQAEHICCAMSSKSTETGIREKKNWLAERINEGLCFKKLDARGKVFIEYIPAESAWVPIDADGYMYINCFWVSGSYKRQGYGKRLLAECEQDARALGCNGVVLITGNMKKPYLSDKAFMLRQGYEVCDSCLPYFELVVKYFEKEVHTPCFRESAKLGMGEGIRGIDIFYTAQCPFTIPYIKLLEPVIQGSNYPVRCHQITTREAAQNHFAPVTTYNVFIDGVYYTNEIQTPDKLKKLIEKINS